MLSCSRGRFPGAAHAHTLSLRVQHMLGIKTLHVELRKKLMCHSTGEAAPRIHLSGLPKENQAKPEQAALDIPDALNSDNPQVFIYKKLKGFRHYFLDVAFAYRQPPLLYLQQAQGRAAHYPAHHTPCSTAPCPEQPRLP